MGAPALPAEHMEKASAGIIRHALQQLEALGLLEKSTKAKGGRRITPEGQRQMDVVAGTIKVARFHYL
jgi:small subunit ribosomal protein S19e